jgi:hemerythrin
MNHMFEWKDAYSVKIPSIDAQHKTLFGLANDLNSAMTKGHGQDVLSGVLDRLVSTRFRTSPTKKR